MKEARLTVLLCLLAACGRPGPDAAWHKQDTHRPVVAGTCPADGDVGVSTDVVVRIYLDFPGEDEPDLDVLSVQPRDFSLVAAPDRSIPLEVYVDIGGSTILVDPYVGLTPLVEHTLYIGPGITDVHSNTLDSPEEIHFTTGEKHGDSCATGMEDEP